MRTKYIYNILIVFLLFNIKVFAEDVNITQRDYNLGLEKENAELKSYIKELSVWVLDNFQEKFLLARKYINKLKFDAADGDLILDKDIEEFLKITSEEKDLIEDAYRYISSMLYVQEERNLKISNLEDGRISFEVSAFPDDGGILREDLYAALESVLGCDRVDLFIDVAADSLEKSFHYFGNAARVVSFQKIQPKDQNDKNLLLINDSWYFKKEENDNIIITTQGREFIVDKIPKEYALFEQYLPKD